MIELNAKECFLKKKKKENEKSRTASSCPLTSLHLQSTYLIDEPFLGASQLHRVHQC